jgi:hypothetical protein
MNTLDTELRDWRREWREQALPSTTVAELARSVQRGSRNAVYGTLAAAFLTLIAVAPLVRRAIAGTIDTQFLSGILAFVVLVWVAALWLARGTWRPRDESTAAFLEVSIRRCRAAMLGVPVAFVLYAAELIYVIISMQRIAAIDVGSLVQTPQFIAVGWIGGPLYLAGQLWYGHRQRQRLMRLRLLQSQLADAPADPAR